MIRASTKRDSIGIAAVDFPSVDSEAQRGKKNLKRVFVYQLDSLLLLHRSGTAESRESFQCCANLFSELLESLRGFGV